MFKNFMLSTSSTQVLDDLSRLREIENRYVLLGESRAKHTEKTQAALAAYSFPQINRAAIEAAQGTEELPIFCWAAITYWSNGEISLSGRRIVEGHTSPIPPVSFAAVAEAKTAFHLFDRMLLLWEAEDWQEIPVDPAIVGEVGEKWFLIKEWELTPQETEFFC